MTSSREKDPFPLVARALGWSGAFGARADDLGRDLGDTVAWEGMVELASRELVTPALYRGLADRGLLAALPTEVRGYLEAVHELNGERNRRIADQLQGIVATLNAAGIEPVPLKGVGYLLAGLYGDPAARVIGDIDLLVAADELPAAVAALAASGYRDAAVEGFSFAAHHHHTPLARGGEVAVVELHTEPVARAFATLLPAAQMLSRARPIEADGRRLRLPAPQDQIVLNIVHAQLADRSYWLARTPLRPLADLLRLRAANDAQIDWHEVLSRFERAGHGSACRAWLMTAEQLCGQGLPAGVRPDVRARVACWRTRAQRRRRWLMAAGEGYGYHRALLAQARADPGWRRFLLTRLLHPNGYRRYARALRAHIGRAL